MDTTVAAAAAETAAAAIFLRLFNREKIFWFKNRGSTGTRFADSL